jgi:hypothetical protein
LGVELQIVNRSTRYYQRLGHFLERRADVDNIFAIVLEFDIEFSNVSQSL